jgi:hypothetical protein
MTESAAPHDGDMLTTGQAAEVIGYGTTRKQVIAMLSEGSLPHVRLGEKKWAKIPRAAALAKRRALERQLRGQDDAPDRPEPEPEDLG